MQQRKKLKKHLENYLKNIIQMYQKKKMLKIDLKKLMKPMKYYMMIQNDQNMIDLVKKV